MVLGVPLAAFYMWPRNNPNASRVNQRQALDRDPAYDEVCKIRESNLKYEDISANLGKFLASCDGLT